MKTTFMRLVACSGIALLLLASTANAQTTNFSTDVAGAIDDGLAWLDAMGAFNNPSSAGDAAGLTALALLEKRMGADPNALTQGYADASPADQARLDRVMAFIINRATVNSFYAYRDGADLMALSVYLRSGGPDQAGAIAAINNIFDRIAANQGTVATGAFGYWCYTNGFCPDSSTTQFVVAGLAAARGVFSAPAYADPARLAALNTLAANSRQAYENNGTPDLDPSELGHGYNPGHPNSIQQTASGLWIQLAGGANLNSSGVQKYLRWIYHHYRYSGIASESGGGWPSYYYYMWSQEKALSFLDDSGVAPLAGNISTADLGTLTPLAAPAYFNRQMHRDPLTDFRPAARGVGGVGYYGAESARWYYDGAYTLMTLQVPSGQFSDPVGEGRWEDFSTQAYAILYLERSVGGGCLDTDNDGYCDSDDNCPAIANPEQEDVDSDDIGDACDDCTDVDADDACDDVDNCPGASNPDQADSNGNGIGDACECADTDGDGICDEGDSCPGGDDRLDSDGDGVADFCDSCPDDAANDPDGDGVCSGADNCPAVANPDQADANGNGVGDACDEVPPLAGRMTGGGSIASGDRVTHGFELHCAPSALPNNLQVNWGRGNRFHLTGVVAASCVDDPAIASNPPMAGFDTYVGTGTGTYNGTAGATIEWRFTDAGEPGRNDTTTIVIRDAANVIVLSVSGTLSGGNHQAHTD